MPAELDNLFSGSARTADLLVDLLFPAFPEELFLLLVIALHLLQYPLLVNSYSRMS